MYWCSKWQMANGKWLKGSGSALLCLAVAHMTRPGGLVQPPGNECTCGNWHRAHTAGSDAAMPWSSRLARGLVLACGECS